MGVVGFCDWVFCWLDPNGFPYNTRPKSSETVGVLLCFVISLLLIHKGEGEECVVVPLGMESGKIASSQISASSTYDLKSVGPQNARIRQELVGGAWCPKNIIAKDNMNAEFIEVDLEVEHRITSTETQGRFGNGFGMEFADKVKFEFWRPRLGKWVHYRDSSGRTIFNGNANTYTGVKQEFNPPIFASRLRFIPHSIHPRTVCMRVEIYGCVNKDGIVSYDVPQGYHNNNIHPREKDYYEAGVDFRDNLYDGQILEGNVDESSGKPSTLLFGGRGILTDSILGSTADFSQSKVNGWMGWRNESTPIKIQFHFDRLRKFEAVKVHVSNLLEYEAQAQNFASLTVFSSVNGGAKLSKNEIVWIPKQKKKMENLSSESSSSSLSVEMEEIPLKGLTASFILLQFVHSNKWLLISEISFVSVPADNNTAMVHSLVPQQDEMMTSRVLSSSSLATMFGVASASVSLCIIVFSITIFVCFIFYVTRRHGSHTKLVGFVGMSTPKSMSIGNNNEDGLNLNSTMTNSASSGEGKSSSRTISTISGNLTSITISDGSLGYGNEYTNKMQLRSTLTTLKSMQSDRKKHEKSWLLKNNTNKGGGWSKEDLGIKRDLGLQDISSRLSRESAVGKWDIRRIDSYNGDGNCGFTFKAAVNSTANCSDGSVPSSSTRNTMKTILGESDLSSTCSSGYVSISNFSQQQKQWRNNSHNDNNVSNESEKGLAVSKGDSNNSNYHRNLSSRLHPTLTLLSISSPGRISSAFVPSQSSSYLYSSSSKLNLMISPSFTGPDVLPSSSYYHRFSSPQRDNTNVRRGSSQSVCTISGGLLPAQQSRRNNQQEQMQNRFERDLSFRNSQSYYDFLGRTSSPFTMRDHQDHQSEPLRTRAESENSFYAVSDLFSSNSLNKRRF